MTPSDRTTMTNSSEQRPESVQRLRPRARSLDHPRFKQRVSNEYPAGYLAQLARPFTSRRIAGGRRLRDGFGDGSLATPAR